MDRQRFMYGAGGLALIAIPLFSVLTAVFGPAPASNAAPACDRGQVVSNVLVAAGFTPDQFVIGEERFNLNLPAALEAGNGAFTAPLTTKQGLIDALRSGQPATEALLNQSVQQSGGTREQALDPNNWVGFQLLTASDWSGNTLFVDGQVKPAGTRHSDVGDIGWVFVNPDDCSTNANVVRIAIVRLGCGNPQLVPPSPPGAPPPPPQLPPQQPPRRPPPTTTPTTQPCVKPPKPASTADYAWEWRQDSCQWVQVPNPANQPPQSNPCCDTGPTPGAPPEPVTPPPGPPPEEGTPPPDPNDTGYDSGSPDGSGTPGGSTCDSGGCTGGGSTPPSDDPTPVDDGDHTEDPGQPDW